MHRTTKALSCISPSRARKSRHFKKLYLSIAPRYRRVPKARCRRPARTRTSWRHVASADLWATGLSGCCSPSPCPLRIEHKWSSDIVTAAEYIPIVRETHRCFQHGVDRSSASMQKVRHREFGRRPFNQGANANTRSTAPSPCPGPIEEACAPMRLAKDASAIGTDRVNP